MADGDGVRPPDAADKSLGDIVRDVSEKSSLLVREEIQLAQTELRQKASRLARGAAAGAAASVFALLALIYLLHALAFLFWDLTGLSFSWIWLGYVIVTVLLLVLGVAGGLLARRFVMRATPPKPEIAIEEARKTREAIEEARG